MRQGTSHKIKINAVRSSATSLLRMLGVDAAREMGKRMLDDKGLNLLFRDARSQRAWADKSVSETTLRQLYDLAILGPTSANCLPMRLVFVKSSEAKKKLKPCLGSNNVEKVMAAPVTAIVAYDLEFAKYLPNLFPHADAKSWFTGNPGLTETTALRNGSMQGAYMILAARSLGLDCGPMSGFDHSKVDEAFFNGTSYRSNFLCSLGYGDHSAYGVRLPRFDFDEICKLV